MFNNVINQSISTNAATARLPVHHAAFKWCVFMSVHVQFSRKLCSCITAKGLPSYDFPETSWDNMQTGHGSLWFWRSLTSLSFTAPSPPLPFQGFRTILGNLNLMRCAFQKLHSRFHTLTDTNRKPASPELEFVPRLSTLSSQSIRTSHFPQHPTRFAVSESCPAALAWSTWASVAS